MVKPVIRRKITWQSCSVQTVAETTMPPVNVDKCLKKIARIANKTTTECCPVKELHSIRQSQTREFHTYHSKQPRTQLLTEAPRIEGEILRRNQHQRAQRMVERESTDKLTSCGQIKVQKHNKSSRIQEANISTASIT